MKVLYLTESLTIPGGRARFSRDLITVMADEQGVEPVLLCAIPDPLPGCKIMPEPVGLVFSEWPGQRQHLGSVVNAWRMRPYLDGVDLIHALAEPFGTTAWLASLVYRRPYLISGLGTYAVEPFLMGRYKWLARHVFRNAAAVPCISAYTKHRLDRVCDGAPSLTVPIGHTEPTCRLDPGSNPGRPYFLTVGPLKTRKGQIYVLQAFKALAEEFPWLDWVVAGYSYNQNYPDWFREQVEKEGLTGRVHLLGTVSEETLQGLYSGCLFNVLTPISDDHAFEGFGLTYLEAGWHAKPSIASLECGAGESIDDGVEGFLVPPADVGRLAEAMTRMIESQELREGLGLAARERALRMTWSATGRRLAELYREVVSTHGR